MAREVLDCPEKERTHQTAESLLEEVQVPILRQVGIEGKQVCRADASGRLNYYAAAGKSLERGLQSFPEVPSYSETKEGTLQYA